MMRIAFFLLMMSVVGFACAQSAEQPHRFHMQQHGKNMTADDFDVWMKMRGIRILGEHTSEQPPQKAIQIDTPVNTPPELSPKKPPGSSFVVDHTLTYEEQRYETWRRERARNQ